ncbi:nucleotidyltransferase family protein [Thalassotalea piscium]
MNTLIILAAGNGTRFGGPKQLTEFGPLNRPLMAYNIDHAYNAGYRTFIIVCQQQHEQTIKSLPCFRHYTDCQYHTVIQNNQYLPKSVTGKVQHDKPLGTAHALWCCHHLITDNVTVINGDDYYGAQAFALLVNANLANKNQHYLVAYPLKNTLSQYGGVNRGLCTLSTEQQLIAISEVANISQSEGLIKGNIRDEREVLLSKNDLVSMNCWSFHPCIITTLMHLIEQALSSSDKANEVFLPDAVMNTISEGKVGTKVLTSHDEWFGVTYAADSKLVHNKLARLTEKGLFH